MSLPRILIMPVNSSKIYIANALNKFPENTIAVLRYGNKNHAFYFVTMKNKNIDIDTYENIDLKQIEPGELEGLEFPPESVGPDKIKFTKISNGLHQVLKAALASPEPSLARKREGTATAEGNNGAVLNSNDMLPTETNYPRATSLFAAIARFFTQSIPSFFSRAESAPSNQTIEPNANLSLTDSKLDSSHSETTSLDSSDSNDDSLNATIGVDSPTSTLKEMLSTSAKVSLSTPTPDANVDVNAIPAASGFFARIIESIRSFFSAQPRASVSTREIETDYVVVDKNKDIIEEDSVNILDNSKVLTPSFSANTSKIGDAHSDLTVDREVALDNDSGTDTPKKK